MGCSGSKAKKISKSDLNFLLENTQFTKDQIKIWYTGFYQDCPSGKIIILFIGERKNIYFL
jgi:hypothetical protein